MLIYTQNHLVVEGFMLMLERGLCIDYLLLYPFLLVFYYIKLHQLSYKIRVIYL